MPSTQHQQKSPEHGPFKNGLLKCQLFMVPLLLVATLVVIAASSIIYYLNNPDISQTMFFVQLGFIGIAILLLGILIVQTRRRWLEPMKTLNRWSSQIRSGDLKTHLDVPNRSELGLIISDINYLTTELHELTEEMDAKVSAQTEHIANKSRSLEILYDIATSLSTARNLDELLDQFLDTLMTLVDARAASVRLLSGNGQTRMVASRGLDKDVVEQELLVDIDRCLCGTISQEGGLGIQKGVEACNQFLSCQMVAGRCSEVVVVPLQYRDQILGVYNLFLDTPSSELGKDARDLLNSIGKHLGLAVEKATMDDNARRLAIMEERNMIGNELHDSLAQSLVSMRLQVKMLGEILHRKDMRSAQSELRDLHTSIEQAHTSLRDLLSNFRTRIDERGLLYAIEDYVQQFAEETNIKAFFQSELKNTDLNLTPTQEIQAFRIVQEALTNVRKHSKASTVRVKFSMNKLGEFSLLVEDDGIGMEEAMHESHRGEHVGMDIMNERAAALDGDLTIESELQEGTSVYLTFPAQKQSATSVEGIQIASLTH